MRIEYKILWVEDEKNWYEESKDLIGDYLEDLGFIIESKHCKTFEEVKSEHSLNQLKEYDLLLVDFSLAGSPDGDEIIKFIRDQKENPILTDVIFYSNDIESVRNSIKKYEFEGVYTSHRNDFITKAEQVIDTTIKKVQEVNTMRGLIMAETSDLDDLMRVIIQKLLKSDISEQIETYINELLSGINSDLEKYQLKDIQSKVEHSGYFNSLKKAKTINKLYKIKQIGIDKFAHKYDSKVISTQNLFAHVTESVKDGEKVLVSHITGKEEVFNEERCTEIRKDLIEFREILENINEQLE